MRLIIFFLLIFFLPWQSDAASPKTAIKLLQKEKYDKVEKQLKKLLAKDSINPGAHYVYSLLYLDSGYVNYDIDTAWHHIQTAIVQYKEVDEKALKKLNQADINDSTLQVQKLRVDTAAYTRARKLHTIAGYDFFIEHHPTAPQLSQAIELRNAIAWQEAKAVNTYESYLYFIKTYPEASQIKEAVELYDILLYREKTKGGALQDYVNFLRENPDSPYRSDAEYNILKLSCTSNEIADYQKFLQQFPKSDHAYIAKNFLYHTYKETNPANTFFDNFLVSRTDSLQNVISLEDNYWIAVLDENSSLYGFRDQNWQLTLDTQYRDILSEYLCGNIISDVLEVSNDKNKQIVSRNGAVIWSENFESFKDIGYGFLKIRNNDQVVLLHKSGYLLQDIRADDASILGGKFIKIMDNNKAGLITFFGLPLLDPLYDEISYQHDLLILEKDGMFALAKPEMISGIVNEDNYAPRFLYDEVEILANGMIRGYRRDAETILDKNLQTVIPFEKHQIYQVNQGWLIKQENQYQVLNENLQPITNSGFDRVQYNEQWMALKKGKKWTFFDAQAEILAGFIYDSVRIISKNFAYLAMADSALLYTSTRKKFLLEDHLHLNLIKDVNLASKPEEAEEFISVKYIDGTTSIYNKHGKKILNGKLDQVAALGNEYFLIAYRNKSLYDTTGTQLLKAIYDGIGNYENGFVSLLRNKKFGIYNKMLGVEISPQYSAMLKPFGDSLIMAAENGRWGLLDLAGDKVLDFGFKKIEIWNDTSVLALTEENTWQVIALSDERVLLDKIDNYTFIKKNEAEKIIRINAGALYGIFSNIKGEIIPPTFNEIINLGNDSKPLYFAEKNIREADFFVIIYYDDKGAILQRQAFTADQYENVYCQ
ncbi:MAG: tetratricopeptide repeat protein [Cyclobacteriaceae bacterium]